MRNFDSPCDEKRSADTFGNNTKKILMKFKIIDTNKCGINV